MQRSIRRLRAPRSLATLLAGALLALAAAPEAGAQAIRNKSFGKALQAAYELMTTDPPQAEAALRTLDDFRESKLKGYDLAKYHEFRGQFLYALERVDETISEWKKALAIADLKNDDPNAYSRLQFNLAQLYLASEKPKQTSDLLEQWFRGQKELGLEPKPQAYYVLALAYYQQERFDRALAAARLAVLKADKPRKGWLGLLIGLYIEKEDFKGALPHVEEMVTHFPSGSAWRQLAQLYNALGREQDALASYQIAYQEGYLDSDRDLQRLARMYLSQDIPFRAAEVLQTGLQGGKVDADAEAFELLANSWINSRELDKAIEPMKRAAELWDTGDLYIRLAQVYMEQDRWPEAEEAFENAFRKGALKKEGRAHLLLGVTRFNLKQLAAAENAFQRAARYEDVGKSATDWLRHIDLERKTRAAQQRASSPDPEPEAEAEADPDAGAQAAAAPEPAQDVAAR